MSSPDLARDMQRELQYQIRGEFARGIRKSCPKGDPMVACITVMLGMVLLTTAFNRIFKGDSEGRAR